MRRRPASLWRAAAQAFLAGVLFLAGCGASPAALPTPRPILPTPGSTPSVLPPLEDVLAVARVNEVEIPSTVYGQELLRNAKLMALQQGVDWYSAEGQARLPALREEILDQLINQELLRQLAEAEGVEVDEARVRALAASAAQQLVQQLKYESFTAFLKDFRLSEEEFVATFRFQVLYQEMFRRHGGPPNAEQVQIRHILTFTEEDAREAKARLDAGEPFERVAREVSEEPGTRLRGGLIEWLPRGMLPAELEERAFSLPIGQTSEVFHTESGYHIIQVLGREVRPVRQEVLERYRQSNFQRWFAEQKAKARIVKYVTFLPPTPVP